LFLGFDLFGGALCAVVALSQTELLVVLAFAAVSSLPLHLIRALSLGSVETAVSGV